jgi:hypothetical protein
MRKKYYLPDLLCVLRANVHHHELTAKGREEAKFSRSFFKSLRENFASSRPFAVNFM